MRSYSSPDEQGLDRLSRGEQSSLHSDENVNTAFERRCADAFRCLGFEVESLGQGRGRKADCLALAGKNHSASSSTPRYAEMVTS